MTMPRLYIARTAVYPGGMLLAWMRIAHVVGFTTWIAGILIVWSLTSLVRGVDASSRLGVISGARAMALLMDIGGLVAIVTGLHMAITLGAFAKPWLHVKLTLVVVGILLAHVVLRMRLGQLRRGNNPVTPRPLAAIVLLSMVAIVTLALHPTLLR